MFQVLSKKKFDNFSKKLNVIVIKKLPTTKVQGQMASQANSIKHLEELTPTLLKLFQKLQRKEHS